MSIDLSLDRLQLLVTHLPSYTRPTCHIAGTNGKGSVAAITSSILRQSLLTVGRYNSPHLVSIYDCIILNGEPIKPETYAKARAEIEYADREHDTKLSSFELLTLTALHIFEQAKVDVAVVEVGMGGRLDATNIIPDEAVLVSALAAVDLDHQFFLGDTVSAIAREKAGIARLNKPFVLGAQKNAEVHGVVHAIVDSLGGKMVHALTVAKDDWDEAVNGPQPSKFSLSATSFVKPAPQPVRVFMPCFGEEIRALFPLFGEHQLDNLGTALAAISSIQATFPDKITTNSVIKGIQSVVWAGRLSFHTITISPAQQIVVLADGAHNPASAATLGAFVDHLLSTSQSSKVNITYILALSHSPPKTPLQTLGPILLPQHVNVGSVNVAVLRFSPPEGMPWVKSVPPVDMASVVRDLAPKADIFVVGDGSSNPLSEALTWAAGKCEGDSIVVLAGSLYLVADFYRFLEVQAA